MEAYLSGHIQFVPSNVFTNYENVSIFGGKYGILTLKNKYDMFYIHLYY
jgi:hypothetical protein